MKEEVKNHNGNSFRKYYRAENMAMWRSPRLLSCTNTSNPFVNVSVLVDSKAIKQSKARRLKVSRYPLKLALLQDRG